MDCIHAQSVKLSSHIISKPLAQIFNVSVSSGSFPANLKTAKVVPVFKSGDESKPGNYRPISLLSIFNRIFEKLVYKRLIKFVNKHNILYSSQYGFRSRHSTQHATLEILNDIFLILIKANSLFVYLLTWKRLSTRLIMIFFSQNSKITASEEWWMIGLSRT